MKKRWKILLNEKLLVGAKAKYKAVKGSRSRFVKDHDRILFSDAFRRLNDKTQVFPLSEDDHIHTRLTHSLEVAGVGRSLGIRAGRLLRRKGFLPPPLDARDIGDVVAAACLAHDIGNPPFGHSGEDAISEWVRKNCSNNFGLSPDQYFELCNFEGNALGFRVLTRHQRPRKGGLRLSCATLAAFAKYPNAAFEKDRKPSGVQHKKYGFLRDDASRFQVVAREAGLQQLDEFIWARHPLAFLVEAADDICYSVIDLEDGFRLRKVAYPEIDRWLSPIAEGSKGFKKKRKRLKKNERGLVSALRADSIDTLIRGCFDEFESHFEEISKGEHHKSLLDTSEFGDRIGRMKKELVVPCCYQAQEVLEIERAGFEVLGGLLHIFYEAISPHVEKSGEKTRQLFPTLQVIGSKKKSSYWKLVRLIEFVSGMTDRYALRTFRKLSGMELPGIGARSDK
ncbi:MAG: dGTP triphosphohydrolase [Acidobacteriota bacterium]